MTTRRSLAALLVSTLALSALASQSRADTTYFLRTGSTEQEGCFTQTSLCTCDALPPVPLRGHFTLVPILNTAVETYNITDVHFRAPALPRTFDGTGAYTVFGTNPGMENLSFDLIPSGLPERQWYAGTRVYHPSTTIDQTLSFPSDCFEIILTIHATPFRSDWNGDGAIGMDDIFAFLNAWLAGDGDANEDGQSTITDIFDFLNSWLSGV